MDLMQGHLAGLYLALSELPLNGLFSYQWDAIISLSYNIGFETFHTSTIYDRLLYRDTDLSPWHWFVKDQKNQVQPGLQDRRALELRLFTYGIYKGPIGQGRPIR
jgi:GH24 family phage-related lysozyme (muramidase)